MRRIHKSLLKFTIFDGSIYLFLIFVGIITLYPFWNILALSFNDAVDTLIGGVYLWPRAFTLVNYETVLNMQNLLRAFENSILRTVLGVVCGLIATTMLAYTISRKDYIFRKVLQRIFVITMYVNGGLIPVYFVIKGLGLRNNFLVYIIPMLINAYYVIVVRSFMDNLPDSLLEAAKIDGANDFKIFYKIVLPLCTPVIAAITLFIAVDQWNAWFDTFIYTSKASLTTIQYELMQVLTKSTSAITSIDQIRINLGSQNVIQTTPESLRMAITIIATLPILLVYPFIQSYFIKGITIGGVKE
jgi:putative aldouronate transport system permease protein